MGETEGSLKMLLGLNSMWMKTTALQKAGVTTDKKTCADKSFLQMHATNNHSDNIVLLKKKKKMLKMFPSVPDGSLPHHGET